MKNQVKCELHLLVQISVILQFTSLYDSQTEFQ